MRAENPRGGQTTGGINCPKCSTPMQEARRYKADIDYCPSCKGVWLDGGKIDKIAIAQDKSDGERSYGRYSRDKDDDDYYRDRGQRRKRGFFGDLLDFD